MNTNNKSREDSLNGSQMLSKISAIRHFYYGAVINPLYVIGIVGNLLIITVFYRLGRQRPTSHSTGSQVYLIWLAVFDLLYCLFMFEYTGFAWNFSSLEDLSNTSCALLFYLRGVSGHATGLIFCAFSVDRLLTVKMAFQRAHSERSMLYTLPITKPNATRKWLAFRKWKALLVKKEMVITVCLMLAALATMPRLLSFRLLENENHHVACMARKETAGLTILHMVLHLLVQRVGPGSVIFLTNILIHRQLRQNVLNSSSLLLSQRAKSELKLVKACALLGIVFFVLSIPPGIHWTIIYSWILQTTGSYPSWLQVHFLVGDMESITASLNSVVNFFVYLIVLDYFRNELYEMTCSKFRAASYKNSNNCAAIDINLRIIEATSTNGETTILASD